ncbi:unnamed protein product [Lactuca saligna]|uniref:Uncharacterized protein n=1 Tax=Lactuca saligna TaxID=75948 RepID=A0AA36A2Q0_LACSI|nr:unnamed protein product [Lactuca saligna]
MFGLKNFDPPDPDRHRLYEEELDVEPGAVRRGRKVVYKDYSPYFGDKPPRLKEKIKNKIIRNLAENENVDPNIINLELEAYDKVFVDGKKLEEKEKIQNQENAKTIVESVEEKGFVTLSFTSDMLEGFNSSIDKVSSSLISASSPGEDVNPIKGILGKDPVANQTIPNAIPDNVKMVNQSNKINDEIMKENLNEDEKVSNDIGVDLKNNHVGSFLDLKWDAELMNMDIFSMPKISTAAKMVSVFNNKCYARMVESSSTVFDLNIKVIPKGEGKQIGKVKLPYADLMFGGAPYHVTRYGFFVGKKLAFPTVNYLYFKMWKVFGLKDVMVNDEGFFFCKFDSK